MDYSALLDAIEARLREMHARAEAEHPMAAQRGVPELVGWALEKIPAWREALRVQKEDWTTKGDDWAAEDAREEIDSLARALGIHGERG
jgi:hypothetical protein